MTTFTNFTNITLNAAIAYGTNITNFTNFTNFTNITLDAAVTYSTKITYFTNFTNSTLVAAIAYSSPKLLKLVIMVL